MAEENGSLLGQQGNTAAQGDASLLGQKDASTPPAQVEGQKQNDPKQGQEQGKQEPPKQVVPEKYADFKLPEGMTLDAPLAEKFTGVAKELGLTQENAQKLVDLQAEAAKGHSEAILKQFNQTTNEWKEQTIKELGADYQKELGAAAKAIDRFGSKELRELFNETGIGNHPEVVKAFVKIGKLISEDGFVDGKKQGQIKTDGELFYPGMKK